MKRIGILTSGGDSPGMNCALEWLVRLGIEAGYEVWGLRQGFVGLARGNFQKLKKEEVRDISAYGGTILGTSRRPEFERAGGMISALKNIKKYRIKILVILGGEGSFKYGALSLEKQGVRCLGIPCTIDNDVWGSDYSLGFDTACNKAIKVIDDIRDTARALPGRIFMVETLGGNTGFLARAVGQVSGAEAILVPEIKYNRPEVVDKIKSGLKEKGYALLVVSEGVGKIPRLVGRIEKATGVRVRLTTLGHSQRGGAPSFFDRWLAQEFSQEAIKTIKENISGMMIGLQKGKVVRVPLREVARQRKELK